MNIFGKRLKELRELNGYSQEELARQLNISRSRVGMYEQGRREPDFEMLEAIADLFNVNMDYLLKKEALHSELTQDELLILAEYRDSDSQTKEMVKRLLSYRR